MLELRGLPLHTCTQLGFRFLFDASWGPDPQLEWDEEAPGGLGLGQCGALSSCQPWLGLDKQSNLGRAQSPGGEGGRVTRHSCSSGCWGGGGEISPRIIITWELGPC